MKILLLHFGQLGDAVMALPAAQALRRHDPGAEITVLAARGGDAIFRMAGFNALLVADRMRWKRQPLAAAAEIPALLFQLRRRRFDLSVDLHAFKETNLLAWAAAIPRRVAMLRPTRSWPRLITHPPPPDNHLEALIDRYCQVLEPLGIAVADRAPRLEPAASDLARLAPAFCEPMLGLCPGAGNRGRRWPAERFAALAAGFPRVAVFAGPEEDEATLAPLRALPQVTVWSGLSIPQLAAALALCRVVVTNPTGPSHIAAAVGARVVTLGEVPQFDPVGRVTAIRARLQVSDITTAEALAALQSAWAEPPPPRV